LNLSRIQNTHYFEWILILMIANKESWFFWAYLEIINSSLAHFEYRTSWKRITCLKLTIFGLSRNKNSQFFWIFRDDQQRAWTKSICSINTDLKTIFLSGRLLSKISNCDYSIIRGGLLQLIDENFSLLNESHFRLTNHKGCLLLADLELENR
jgi:hypothetical protein